MVHYNWQKIFETSFQHRAEILCDYLEQQGIASVIINKQDSSYVFMGKYQLYVANEDVAVAQKIASDEIAFK